MYITFTNLSIAWLSFIAGMTVGYRDPAFAFNEIAAVITLVWVVLFSIRVAVQHGAVSDPQVAEAVIAIHESGQDSFLYRVLEFILS